MKNHRSTKVFTILTSLFLTSNTLDGMGLQKIRPVQNSTSAPTNSARHESSHSITPPQAATALQACNTTNLSVSYFPLDHASQKIIVYIADYLTFPELTKLMRAAKKYYEILNKPSLAQNVIAPKIYSTLGKIMNVNSRLNKQITRGWLSRCLTSDTVPAVDKGKIYCALKFLGNQSIKLDAILVEKALEYDFLQGCVYSTIDQIKRNKPYANLTQIQGLITNSIPTTLNESLKQKIMSLKARYDRIVRSLGDPDFEKIVTQELENGYPINFQYAKTLALYLDETNTSALKILIDKGYDLNARNYIGTTPLEYAIAYKHVSLALALIEKLAPEECNTADKDHTTPLYYATRLGQTKIALALIEKLTPEQCNTASKDGETPLYWAAREGHTQIALTLIEKLTPDQCNTANTKGDTPLYQAAYHGHTQIARALIEKLTPDQCNTANIDGDTPLYQAARYNYIEVALALIKKLTPKQCNTANKGDRTLLPCATFKGHTQIALALIKKLIPEQCNTANWKGETPLFWAVYYDDTQVALALIEKLTSEQCNTANIDGETPLLWAARYGRTQIALTLINKLTPEQCNTADWKGKTPLFWAKKKDHAEIIQALISKINTPEN